MTSRTVRATPGGVMTHAAGSTLPVGSAENVRSFLSGWHEIGGRRPGIPGLILEHGSEWRAQALTAPHSRGPRGQCFQNALELAERFRELTYVEGYADRVIPVHHAWCVTASGNVVDVTWDLPENGAYFGIPFKTAFVGRETDRVGHYGVLTNPETVARLLRLNPKTYLRREPR